MAGCQKGAGFYREGGFSLPVSALVSRGDPLIDSPNAEQFRKLFTTVSGDSKTFGKIAGNYRGWEARGAGLLGRERGPSTEQPSADVEPRR